MPFATIARMLAEVGRDHQPRVWPGAPVTLTWPSSGRKAIGQITRVASPDSDGVVREALVAADGVTYRVTRADRVDPFSFPQWPQPGAESDAFVVAFPAGPGAPPFNARELKGRVVAAFDADAYRSL